MTAFPAAPFIGFSILFGAPTRARFAAAARDLVDRRPRAASRLIWRDATILVAFLDVFGLTFLFVSVGRFVASGHDALLLLKVLWKRSKSDAEPTPASGN